MDWNQIAANLLNGFGAVFILYSTFTRKRRNVLFCQTAACALNAIVGVLINSYSAFVSNFITIFTNFFNAKEKLNKTVTYAASFAMIVFGLLLNTSGFLGFLPVLASVEYLIFSQRAKTTQELRYVLLGNCIMWLVYNISVNLFFGIAANTIVTIFTLYNIFLDMYKNRNVKWVL